MRFLACDSSGKTSSKGRAYCYAACQATNTSACAYKPGAALDEIMRGVVAEVPLSQYRAGTIVSMANGLSIPFSTWQAGKREHYVREFNIFAANMHAHSIDTTLVFGGDPALWPYNHHLNEDYRLIQRDILEIATGHGIRCFTGMEAQFHGGLGRFANRVDHMGHILGTARDDAVSWLTSILTLPLQGNVPFPSSYVPAAETAPPPPPPISQPPAVMVSAPPGRWRQKKCRQAPQPQWATTATTPVAPVVNSAGSVPPPPPPLPMPAPSVTSAGSVPPPPPPLSTAIIPYAGPVPPSTNPCRFAANPALQTAALRVLEAMPVNEFKDWCRDYAKQWCRNLNDCPAIYEMPGADTPMSVTCLIFTSGSDNSRAQSERCEQRMRALGWRAFILHGIHPEDLPPKGRKAGCKASQAWNAVIMPKVIRATEALREGERLLVAEDSAWPTTACTPSNVQDLHDGCPHDVGLWLGACRGCYPYCIGVGNRDQVHVNCNAPAGCKLFSGTAPFWRRVNEMFLKVSKDYSSDCVFQFLTGIGLVSVAQPFLAISDAHWSDRTGSYEERSYLEGECKPKLRPMAISGNLLA